MLDAIRLKVLLKQLEPFKVTLPLSIESGYLRTIIHPQPETWQSPETNKQWELLGGMIYHVIGDDTLLDITHNLGDTHEPFFRQLVVSTEPSNYIQLDLKSNRIILREGDSLTLQGNVAAYAILRILETNL